MEFPFYDSTEPKWKYFSRLNKYLQFEQNKKRVEIINFINEWLYGIDSKLKLNNLLEFRDFKYNDLPKNSESKKIMIKHFERLNDVFDLNLEYDEELFTTYNMIYFIKLMVETIGFKLKKKIIISKNKSNEEIKTKIYGIYF